MPNPVASFPSLTKQFLTELQNCTINKHPFSRIPNSVWISGTTFFLMALTRAIFPDRFRKLTIPLASEGRLHIAHVTRLRRILLE